VCASEPLTCNRVIASNLRSHFLQKPRPRLQKWVSPLEAGQCMTRRQREHREVRENELKV